MAKKIIIAVSVVLGLIILSIVLYKFTGGSFSKFANTTKELSFLQAIKDMFMTIYKGIINKF